MIAHRVAPVSAALLMALSLALPLAAPPVPGVVLRPAALTMTLVAVVLFALAGARAPATSIAFGPAGVVIGAWLTVALLADPEVAGAAAAGFWTMVVATWMTGKIARMNPAAVFVSLLFWGWLWGVWGLLLGVPVVMVLKVVAERVEGMEVVAELLGEYEALMTKYPHATPMHEKR